VERDDRRHGQRADAVERGDVAEPERHRVRRECERARRTGCVAVR
jgi:hypothetical protein